MKKRFFLSKCFLTTRIKKYISCICDIDALGSLCQILIGWQVAQPIRLTGGLTPAQLQSPSLAKWRDVSSIRPRRRCVRGVTMQEAEQSECEWSHLRPVTDLRLTLYGLFSRTTIFLPETCSGNTRRCTRWSRGRWLVNTFPSISARAAPESRKREWSKRYLKRKKAVFFCCVRDVDCNTGKKIRKVNASSRNEKGVALA